MVLEESPGRVLYYYLLYTITMFVVIVILVLILSCFTWMFHMDIYAFG